MKSYARAQKIPLSRKLDRRCRLTDADRSRICELYRSGHFGQRSIARMFGVCKSTIGMIVNPDRARKMRERQKRVWKIYYMRYGKTAHAAAVRMTRNYKYGLYKAGIIKSEGDKDASQAD